MKMHNSSFYRPKNACATPLSCCTWEEIIGVSNYSSNLIKYTFIYPCFEENRQVVNSGTVEIKKGIREVEIGRTRLGVGFRFVSTLNERPVSIICYTSIGRPTMTA